MKFIIKKVHKNWYINTFILILVVAFLLRVYKIGVVPHGMTWDEAAIGYNGYAVVSTFRDEWLTRLPLSFRSFGDYKAPFAVYLTGLFTTPFGLSLPVVRIPFVLFGVAAIAGIMLLTKTLFSSSKHAKTLSLASGFFLTLSPWHYHYSRAGFESGLALTLVIWALYVWFWAWEQSRHQVLLLTGSATFFVLSLYTYHSTKITVPLLLLFLAIQSKNRLLKLGKKVFIPVSVAILLSVPLLYDLLFQNGLERAGVTIFAQGLSLQETMLLFLGQVRAHISLSFLIEGATTTLRHGDSRHGVMYVSTFILGLYGILQTVWRRLTKVEDSYASILWFSLFLFSIGILPAAVALEVPHSNRALTAVIGVILLAVFGVFKLLEWCEHSPEFSSLKDSRNRKTIYFQLVMGTVFLVQSLFAVEYFSDYYTQFAAESSEAFKDGYVEAFEYVLLYEKGSGGKPEVNKILFTSRYGQPYIYALFVRKTSPYAFHGGSLIKYEFKDSFVEGDLLRENSILVTTPEDTMPFNKATKVIYGSDLQPRFYIFDTNTIKW